MMFYSSLANTVHPETRHKQNVAWLWADASAYVAETFNGFPNSLKAIMINHCSSKMLKSWT